jgi:hypothetical protein
MKTQYWTITASALLLALLSACNNDNGGGGGTPPPTSSNQLQSIASNNGTAEAAAITDQASLQQDIISLFGNADGEPVPVNSGDSLQDVINRAAGQ